MPWIVLPANSYREFATYSDLPPTTQSTGEIVVVQTSTGVWPFRRSAGFYISLADQWTYLGDFTPSYIKSLYEANVYTNAFTNYYKSVVDTVAADQTVSAALEILLDCDPFLEVGDIVIAHPSTDNFAFPIYSNVYDNLAIGICVDKPSTSTCKIRVGGVYSGYGSLVRGKPVFVGVDGIPTTTKPETGHLQIIGVALTATTISINVSPTKVIQ